MESPADYAVLFGALTEQSAFNRSRLVTPDEYLRIPYTMLIASVQRPDGAWVRRAEYPELPGCVAETDSPLDAIDQLDALRERFIRDRLARGEPIPIPRPPLARLR